jgi:hypothetical protein
MPGAQPEVRATTVTFAGGFYQVRKLRLGVELGERRPKIILGGR